jgi:hypothetical protein
LLNTFLASPGEVVTIFFWEDVNFARHMGTGKRIGNNSLRWPTSSTLMFIHFGNLMTRRYNHAIYDHKSDHAPLESVRHLFFPTQTCWGLLSRNIRYECATRTASFSSEIRLAEQSGFPWHRLSCLCGLELHRRTVEEG